MTGHNGTALDSTAAERIELRAAVALSQPLAEWSALPPGWVVVNQRLEATVPTFGTARFLRVQEKSAGP